MPTRNRNLLLSSTCVAALFLAVNVASAQTNLVQLRPGVSIRGTVVKSGPTGQIVRPHSGDPRPGHVGTNVELRIPAGGMPQFMKPGTTGAPPTTGYLIETPASLECVYESGLGGTDAGTGCNPNKVTKTVTGGKDAIAIVDAYDLSTATADLSAFDSQFGLPSATFTKIYASGGNNTGATCNTGGTAPAVSSGWNVEEDLDIEYAHAMAPGAHVYLVEASGTSNAAMYHAVNVAEACVVAASGGEVSMSWGVVGEFASETNYDSNFVGTNVTYFAAAGDYIFQSYPCTSPNVVCVGGTTISRDYDGNFVREEAWYDAYSEEGTGSGLSFYEPMPSYQGFLSSVLTSEITGTTQRGIPDLAAVADPDTGVWIYSTTLGGWYPVGGTSVATPVFAGTVNRAGFIFGSSFNALANSIYPEGKSGQLAPYVTNETSNDCGPYPYLYYIYGITSPPYPYGFNPPYDQVNQEKVSGYNWNSCTGWGSPKDAGNPNWLRPQGASR